MEVFCLQAQSFPAGVAAVHQKLHALAGGEGQRQYFGISFSDGSGNIIYKAAATELFTEEFAGTGLQKMLIRKGNYLYCDIENFMHHIEQIGTSFQQMLLDPRIDPHGFCIEQYIDGERCRCMVRLKDI